MAEEQESQGFRVRDRRTFSPDREKEIAEEQKAEPAREEPGPERPDRETAQAVPLPEPNFSAFLTFFFFQQALMFLGEIPHPETRQPERNLAMAKYLIDTLAIIKEKTKGNLTSEEQGHLENLLTDLRMLYVKAVKV